jgi:uncharacterized protein (DUF362 family)
MFALDPRASRRQAMLALLLAAPVALVGCSSSGASGPAAPTCPGDPGCPEAGTVVSLLQSSKAQASDLTMDDVRALVTDAVAEAGGLGFITDGMTVVLKPNLLTHLAACWGGTATLPPMVNGVSTDWRVTHVVAELVRARNPHGQVLVIEGSNRNTTDAFNALGYTAANFGALVDDFIPLEGATGCNSRSTTHLVVRQGPSGASYQVDPRYADADVVISIAALKTHGTAGITGAVKNLGIGATPASAYSLSTSAADCTRNYNHPESAASYIDHSNASAIGAFAADFYGIHPADFAVIDGLQGLQNGPCSTSAADRMNMRLVLASRNAVALDAVAARVMRCDPSKVPTLTLAEGYDLGTIDETKITVAGNRQVADVQRSFASGVAGVCE